MIHATLLEKINNKYTPQYISVLVESYSSVDNCFYNVVEKVSIDKGEIIYGWKLHQTSLLAEAERHAVWKSPQGELIDITPCQVYKEKILFLEEDKGWKYNGEYADNIRVNITDNPLVDELILLNEAITKLLQTGKRESKIEIHLLPQIAVFYRTLEIRKRNLEVFIHLENTSQSSCYCESSLTYDNCHGYNLKNQLIEMIEKADELAKIANA